MRVPEPTLNVGIVRVATSNETVRLGFVDEVGLNINIISPYNTAPVTALIEWHLRRSESPTFKLNDEFEVSAVPL